MKKILTLLFILMISGMAFAQGSLNIYLLTSLNEKKGKVEENLAKILTKKLKNIPHTLTFVPGADQEDLYQVMTDPSVDVLFWVSHGGFTTLGGKQYQGLGAQNVIIDSRGDNVAPLFQLVNPKLKFLGIIGCNTQKILDSYGVTQAQSELKTYISSKKEIAQFAIKRAVKKFLKHYKKNELISRFGKEGEDHSSIRLTVRRVMEDNTPQDKIRSIRIMAQGKVIGLIPKVLPGEEVELEISLPLENGRAPVIEFTSGENLQRTPDTRYFGKLTVLSDEFLWKVFSKSSGEAFGGNSLLFLPLLR